MGRDRKNEKRVEHFTKMVRTTMEEPAWRALSLAAQALYPWLKFEWHGERANNNGKIRLSIRQAANKIGISRNTAAKAFHELQAKGFIVMTELPALGLEGSAKAPAFELTEIGLPHSTTPGGRKLYRDWVEGEDFRVQRVPPNNPMGKGGKSKSRPKS